VIKAARIVLWLPFNHLFRRRCNALLLSRYKKRGILKVTCEVKFVHGLYLAFISRRISSQRLLDSSPYQNVCCVVPRCFLGRLPSAALELELVAFSESRINRLLFSPINFDLLLVVSG